MSRWEMKRRWKLLRRRYRYTSILLKLRQAQTAWRDIFSETLGERQKSNGKEIQQRAPDVYVVYREISRRIKAMIFDIWNAVFLGRVGELCELHKGIINWRAYFKSGVTQSNNKGRRWRGLRFGINQSNENSGVMFWIVRASCGIFEIDLRPSPTLIGAHTHTHNRWNKGVCMVRRDNQISPLKSVDEASSLLYELWRERERRDLWWRIE